MIRVWHIPGYLANIKILEFCTAAKRMKLASILPKVFRCISWRPSS